MGLGPLRSGEGPPLPSQQQARAFTQLNGWHPTELSNGTPGSISPVPPGGLGGVWHPHAIVAAVMGQYQVRERVKRKMTLR